MHCAQPAREHREIPNANFPGSWIRSLSVGVRRNSRAKDRRLVCISLDRLCVGIGKQGRGFCTTPDGAPRRQQNDVDPEEDMMRKRAVRVTAAALTGVLVLSVGACGSDSSTPSASGGATATATAAKKAKVGVILPDAASSARWETADRKFLGEAFQAAGVESDIQNANGDKAKFATIADQMLNGGANALLIVTLDSPSAAAVINKAKQQGVPVIDYDRLTLGGGASYYVSFDNVAVGT